MSKKCYCIGCGTKRHDFDAINWTGVIIARSSNGVKMRYYCPRCQRERSYSTENDKRYGTQKNHGFTFSEEWETSYSTNKGRGELLSFDYLPTSDCTVDVEYKSPIHEGLNALSKQCLSIEKMLENGDLEMGSNCGTHFHVGHVDYINDVTMRYLRRFNNSLFVPLSEAIMADVEKSEKLFGRKPNSWAEPVTMYDPSGDYDGYDMKHEAMFNLQHNYTIEFRQAKFVSAKQYMHFVKFAKDCTSAIIENFIKHFNDTDIDVSRYYQKNEDGTPKLVNGSKIVSKTAYRKHKADMTANKLVGLYEKYTKNL